MNLGEYEWDPVDYDPNEPTVSASWRNGDVGDEEWERQNSRLTHEWLRFYERVDEVIDARGRRAPPGWLDVQRVRFRRLLAARYAGQTDPDHKWVQERRRRIEARHGAGKLAEFDAKWERHGGSRQPAYREHKMAQAGDR